MGLLDQVSRLEATSARIRASARRDLHHAGPVSRALLSDESAALNLRDTDDAEPKMFTLVKSSKGPAGSRVDEVGRKEMPSATPLRKRETQEPEVLLRAALKYVDMYGLMPERRAQVSDLLNRVQELRDNIVQLEEALEEARETIDDSGQGEDREVQRAIHELEPRFNELRRKRDALRERALKSKLAQHDKASASFGDTSELDATPSVPRTIRAGSSRPTRGGAAPRPAANTFARGAQGIERTPPKEEPPPPAPAPAGPPPGKTKSGRTIFKGKDKAQQKEASKEELFWSAPRTPSPVRGDRDELDQSRDVDDANDLSDLLLPAPKQRESISLLPPARDDDDDDDDDDDGDTTVVLKPASPPKPKPVPVPVKAPKVEQPPPPRPPPQEPVKALDPESHERKLKFTKEMDAIVEKMWTTVGEIMFPGHPYDTGNGRGTEKMPTAKETIALLHDLTTSTGSSSTTNSPATSSLASTATAASGTPTAHQILTAHLMLALLTSSLASITSSGPGVKPVHSAPLLKLKQHLAQMAIERGWERNAADLALRAIYACVAKKIVAIERGGGEQVLKFVI